MKRPSLPRHTAGGRLGIVAAALTAAMVAALMGCGESTGPNRIEPPSEGMRIVKAAGHEFLQGAAGEHAGPLEGPPISNRFTYDFQMDRTEVTQERFQELMGRNPVPAGSPFGAGPDFPVYHVSWYDAALFCNARSKASGLDTIYAYESVGLNPDGSVHRLDGLVVRLDRRGYRLPTEAEWEFSARAGGSGEFQWGGWEDSAAASEHAWYAGNAGNKAHPVGTLKPNAFGFLDMAGNVMEWVGDWKAAYPDAGTEDFAGARDPSPEADSPVKGGAFKFGLRELRPAARSGIYASIRASKAEYVGFRCALGAVKSPRFSSPGGGFAHTDPVRLDLQRIRNLVEGRPAKLVFVNASTARRHLAYVDYRWNPARLREFDDVGDVFHPSISPDGAWVAFGSAVEGTAEGSLIRVRSLDQADGKSEEIGPGFIPRWWVSEKDTFLVYASSAVDNSQPQWSSSRTLLQKMAGGKPEGAPVALTSTGAFHDGRSLDGRWLATGFRTLKVHDLQSARTATLFTAPGNGKPDEDTSQVCNVSMAPDSTGRILFLDFGSNLPSAITGSYYDIHQVAFMAEPTGKVLRWFKAPPEIRGWEDLEWSNEADYAVSGSTDAAGRHQNLYLIDLKDSSSARLATGTWLATPSLWLGDPADSIPTAGLSLDSLGHYNEPATDVYQSAFSEKMTFFWKRHRDLEVIFTGSSHVFSGIDPRKVTGLQALNIGYPANGWLGQEEWVEGYALNHCPKLKVLVMEAFPGWLNRQDGDFTWLPQISRTLGVQYDRANGYWKDGLPFGFEALVAQAPNATGFSKDSTGYYFQATEGWGTDLPAVVDGDWGLEDAGYQATMSRIEAFLKRMADRNIHVILVNHPTHPGYRNHLYYGPYGPRNTVAVEVIKRFKAMEGISPRVHFYDAHDFGNHDYGDGDASNWGHLSTEGAAKLTGRLDSLIHTLPLP